MKPISFNNPYIDEVGNIKEIRSLNGGGGFIHYSTEETEIGTWLNGKKLYRKTFHFESAGLSADDTWNWIIPKAELETMNIDFSIPVMCEYVNNYQGLAWITNGYVRSSDVLGLSVTCDNSNGIGLLAFNSYSRFNHETYITITYSKTTD